MRDRILDLLRAKDESSGGHNGLTAVMLSQKLEASLIQVKNELNGLYRSKLISVHPGVHGPIAKIINGVKSKT